MKYTVSGDITFPFLIEVEADNEDEAHEKVMNTDPNTLGIQYDPSSGSLEVNIDEVIEEDDEETDVYVHFIRAGLPVRMTFTENGCVSWHTVSSEAEYRRLLAKGYSASVIAQAEYVFSVPGSSVDKLKTMAKSFSFPRKFIIADRDPGHE